MCRHDGIHWDWPGQYAFIFWQGMEKDTLRWKWNSFPALLKEQEPRWYRVPWNFLTKSKSELFRSSTRFKHSSGQPSSIDLDYSDRLQDTDTVQASPATTIWVIQVVYKIHSSGQPCSLDLSYSDRLQDTDTVQARPAATIWVIQVVYKVQTQFRPALQHRSELLRSSTRCKQGSGQPCSIDLSYSGRLQDTDTVQANPAASIWVNQIVYKIQTQSRPALQHRSELFRSSTRCKHSSCQPFSIDLQSLISCRWSGFARQ